MADGNSRSDLPLDGSCPGTFSSVVQKLFQPFSAFHQSHAAVGSLSRDLPLPRSSSVLNYALQTQASFIFLSRDNVLASIVRSVANASSPQKLCQYGFSKSSNTTSTSLLPLMCLSKNSPTASRPSVPGRPRSEKY